MRTKIRILLCEYRYTKVQIWRPWFPVWTEIKDFEYPDVPGDYDPDYSCDIGLSYLCQRVRAYAVAKEYKYLPPRTVKHKQPLKLRIRQYFSGPTGVPGMMGPAGIKGDRGQDGIARSATDVKCKHCGKFRTDYPEQKLVLKVVGKEKYAYRCGHCFRTTLVVIKSGLILAASEVRNVPRLKNRRRS